jgi:multisubunit Na+/H+ antiporter MnhC subunit
MNTIIYAWTGQLLFTGLYLAVAREVLRNLVGLYCDMQGWERQDEE